MFKRNIYTVSSALVAIIVVWQASPASAVNIVMSNDDGWAVAQIRAQYSAFNDAGFDVVLSCPAENGSGTGSLTTPVIPSMLIPCEFDTCPIGSPGVGSNSSDPRLNYVNGFPVDAAKQGLSQLSTEFFGGPPDLLVSGPNVGSNTGFAVLFSGTVGAATEAAKQGIPSVAFSGQSTDAVSYTTLTSDPDSPATKAAFVYAQLTTQFVKVLTTSGAYPLVPSGSVINVNYPALDAAKNCTQPSDVKFVLTRTYPAIPVVTGKDTETCGNGGRLPQDSDVVNSAQGCYASVSVLDATLIKEDASSDAQEMVWESLLGLEMACLSG